MVWNPAYGSRTQTPPKSAPLHSQHESLGRWDRDHQQPPAAPRNQWQAIDLRPVLSPPGQQSTRPLTCTDWPRDSFKISVKRAGSEMSSATKESMVTYRRPTWKRLPFLKSSRLPSHLLEHELKMQQGLSHLAGTPTPICLASEPMSRREPSSRSTGNLLTSSRALVD